MTPEVRAAWEARKTAQWERVAGQMPGLQMIHTKDTFVLAIVGDEFSDSVVYGEPARLAIDGPNDRKLNLPIVDLSDAQLDIVLDRWRRRQKAPKADPFNGKQAA